MPLEFSGISVSLRSCKSKAEIPVYQPDKVNPGTMACFVPSEAGEAFEVLVENRLVSGEGLVSTTFIDGREMQHIATYPYSMNAVQGVYEAAGIRPFTFSKLQLKEDDGQDPAFDLSKLGVIEVQVCRATITKSLLPVAHGSSIKASLDPVSEKAKKVGWHSVSLGAPQPATTETSNATHIDQLSKPYAIFRFRYKPRELLEDEGIAPRIERPKEASTGDKRPRPDEESNAEPSALRQASENVKPESTEGSTLKAPKVEGAKKVPKVEGRVKVERERVAGQVIDLTNRLPSPIRVPVKGEVIDLSDD